MRCQRCQFENIPGESRCFKCGSILSGGNVAVDIHPPRMARWKGPVRAMLRRFRLCNAIPEAIPKPKVPAFMRIMSKGAFVGLILSIIPGLAHYLEDRFREVRWYVLGWFLILLAGIFLYGGNIGLLLLGLAVGLHGWIAFNHKLSKEQPEISEKARTIVLLLVVFAFLYWGFRRTVFRTFVFGYTNMAVPYQNINVGDLLLARRCLPESADLNRGSFVLVRGANITVVGNGNVRVSRNGPAMASQVVGLPGDTVEFMIHHFVVNGQPTDSNQFPVPEWLSVEKIGPIQVPGDSYFTSSAYNVRGNAALDRAVSEVCLVRYDEIEARAIMRWLPLSRRGFLRSDE